MSTTPTRPSTGARVNHLVFNVRDIDASHRFYTEVIGFEQCGELTHNMTMRFYRGLGTSHHDLALVQVDDPDRFSEPERWSMRPQNVGVNHVAIAYPNRESWLEQIHHLRACGVDFIVRGNHGMTHSAYIADPDGYGLEILYELPAEVWSKDVDAALNYFEYLPVDGEESMVDRTDYQRFGPDEEPPVGIPGRISVR